MKTTGRRIIQKSLAIAIILIMTMADLCFIGANLVSYAIDVAKVSNDNIEFKAYFPSENRTLETTVATDKTDLKIAIELGIKKDGYLSNAKIELEKNSNFKFKTDLKNDYIKSLDEESIVFKQINEGDSIKVEVGIEFAYLRESDLDYLNKVSKINLSGTYVNSKNNNTDVKGEAQLKINWVSPEDIKSVLSTDLLTNSIYNENGINKRIVQALVSSKVENNSYPVKETNIELNIPGDPETVTVNKRTTAGTNGENEFTASELSEGKITINVKNGQNDKIEWLKDAKDEFVVTAKYPETEELVNSKITTNLTQIVYDNKELKQSAELMIDENKEQLASISQIESQKEIAKGKIYAGEEKDYVTNSIAYIDYSEAIQKINITENEVKAIKAAEGEKELAVDYKNIRFNKSNITNIFGDIWDIKTIDQANNIKTITNETETDENGNILIEFEKGARVVNIETSNPKNNGVLNYEITKTIVKASLSREKIKELTKIKNSSELVYTKKDNTTNIIKTNSTIDLKETQSKATLKVEPVTLTTSSAQKLNITAVLETNNEYRDLYKNPVIKIKLPKQINKISAECNLMYGNGLEIKKGNFRINEENGHEVITIILNGEQKSFEGNGATLNIIANVELDKFSTNSIEDIIMTYTNENATSYVDNGEQRVNISIASENSMILTNNIEEYNISTFGKESDKEISIANNSEAKNATVKMQIVNNEDSGISNVAIFGKIANISGKIDRTSKIRTNIENVRAYYTSVDNPTISISNTENGWTETDQKNAKYFLIVIGSLEKGQRINISYDIKVGDKLPPNLTTEASYKVSYTNNLSNTKKEVESTKIIITTGKVVELKTALTAKVQGTEIKVGDKVNAGEIIEYTAIVTNTGNEKANNINITATIPEDTTMVELNPKYPGYDETIDSYTYKEPYYTEKTEKQVVKNNVEINKNEKYVLKYMVKVKENLTQTKTGSTKLTVIGAGNAKNDKEFSNVFNPSTLILSFTPLAKEAGEVLQPGMSCMYLLEIKNISNTEQKNVTVTLKENDIIQIDTIEYHSGEVDGEVENDKRSFVIQSIMPNTSAFVRILTTIKQATNKTKQAQIAINVKDSNNVEYRTDVVSFNTTGERLDIKLDTNTSSKNRYVNIGDTIKYTTTIKNIGDSDSGNIRIEEIISDYLNINIVKINGQGYAKYEIIPVFDETSQYSYFVFDGLNIKKGEELTIEIGGKVIDNLPIENEILKVVNKVYVYGDTGVLAETDVNEYYIKLSGIEGESNSDSSNYDSNNPNRRENSIAITGTVWEDKDNNGERSSEEALLEGIKVYAIDVETNMIAKYNNDEIIATTESDGTYVLSGLPKGKYIVAFEFNTEKYMVTSYQVEGVDSTINSDAVKASRIVNDEEKTAAYTDTIDATEDIANIDLGLAEAKVFSLKLDKVISKMIITNKNSSKTYNFEDKEIAKVEIASKELSGSKVVIEYKLKVTNVGEVAGYAKSIVDYLPSSLTFNSGLNSDWYKKGKNLYTSSLADTLIEPGETKEVKLTLTKKMTESNTGLTNNKAEIESAYNSLGIPNTTKTTKNGETQNAGSADTIIGVKTGAAVSYVTLTLTIIIVICGLAYLVNKKLLLEKIEI